MNSFVMLWKSTVATASIKTDISLLIVFVVREISSHIFVFVMFAIKKLLIARECSPHFLISAPYNYNSGKIIHFVKIPNCNITKTYLSVCIVLSQENTSLNVGFNLDPLSRGIEADESNICE